MVDVTAMNGGIVSEYDKQLNIMPSASNRIAEEQKSAEAAEESVGEETLGDRNSMEHNERLEL